MYSVESYHSAFNYYNKLVGAVFITYEVDKDNFNVYVNSFQNPIIILPLFFSILSIFIKATNLFVKLLYKDYKLYKFINDYCDVRTNLEIRKNFSININTKDNLGIDSVKFSEKTKNIFEEKLNKLDYTINSFDKNKLIKNIYVNSESKFKYRSKNLLMFCIPCGFMRSKSIDSEFKILNKIKSDIMNDFDKKVSKESIYSLLINYERLYGDKLFKTDIYSYLIDKNE